MKTTPEKNSPSIAHTPGPWRFQRQSKTFTQLNSTQLMKIPKNLLIEKACSSDSNRPVLGSVYFERNFSGSHKDCLLATNGMIAAVVPVSASESDVAGSIPPEALKASRKNKSEDFSCNGVCKMPDGQEFVRKDLGKYPNVSQIMPKGAVKFTASFDPELLYALAQAIGSERGVTLEFTEGTNAIRVVPCSNNNAKNAKGSRVGFAPACLDAMGAIMPILKSSESAQQNPK